MGTVLKASEFLNGDKLYQQRARKILPILVRQAKVAQKIYYSDLATEVGIPNPRNLNYPLGSIGNALKSLSRKWGIDIPQIQCIVVNRTTGLPGEGYGEFIDRLDFKKLSTKQRTEIVNRVLSEVFSFSRWDDVLFELGLSPSKQSERIKEIIKNTKRYGAGGEGENHKKIKEEIANNPSMIGLRGIKHTNIEYLLPSNDTIDILFKSSNEWIGVEVKPYSSSEDDILRGLYQCIKYNALLEAHLAVLGEFKNVRVILAIGGQFPSDLIPTKNILGVEVIDNILA